VRKTGPPLRLGWLALAPILLVTALAAGALTDTAPLGFAARERLFDLYQRIAPRSAEAAPGGPVVFIAIDKASLERYGPWPWPRTRLAQLATATAAAGARLIAVEPPIVGADPFSPETVGRLWLSDAPDPGLAAALARAPRHDALLAEALGETTALLSVDADRGPPPRRIAALPRPRSPISLTQGRLERLDLPRTSALGAPPEDIGAAAADIGVGVLPADRDGILRRLPMLWVVDNAVRPALSLGAARFAVGAGAIGLEIETDKPWLSGQAVRALTLGRTRLDAEADGALRLYLTKRAVPKTEPAWRILSGDIGAGLKGAVAVIGRADVDAPRSRTARGLMPQAAAHAVAIEQLLSGASLQRPLWARPAEAGAALLIGLLAAILGLRAHIAVAAGAASAAALLAFAGSWAAFSEWRMLIDPWPVSIAALSGVLAMQIAVFARQVMDHGAAHTAFAEFLPQPAIAQLAQTQDASILDGARRPLTVLSCEVRMGAEAMEAYRAHPGALARTVRLATDHVRAHAMAAGGSVDRATGGKVTAFWNAPLENADHAQDACACALSLIESLDGLNDDIEELAEMRGGPFAPAHVAIGIATGPCVIGRTGKGGQIAYSPIGRAVDVATLLRQRAQCYGPAIIVDETTYDAIHHKFAFLEVDLLDYPHEARPSRVYALLGNPFVKASPRFRAVDQAQRALLAAYREGDWTRAAAALAEGREVKGSNHELYDLYEARIDRFRGAPAHPDWTGAEPALF